MRAGGRYVCARCGARRHTDVGVCANCGHDQVDPPRPRRAVALLSKATYRGALNQLLAPIASSPAARFAIGNWGASPAAALYQAAALAVCCVVASLLLGPTLGGFYERPLSWVIALGTIAAALIFCHYQQGQYTWRDLWRKFLDSAHWGWLLVGVAIFLRYALLQFWPPDGPGFEEREVGDIALGIIVGEPVPLAHRTANLLGALGLLTGGFTLDALRFYFQVAGGLSILVMALLLRRLSISWPAVILAVFTMATLRWLVIAGGIADELFASLLLELLLLYCLTATITDRQSRPAWAGMAGLCAGLLMYDYISYFMALVIPPAWWLLRIATSSDTQERRNILRLLVWYATAFTIVAAPAIHSVVADSNSLITEGLRRNREFGAAALSGSLTISSLTAGVQEIIAYAQLLAGWPEDYSPTHFREPGKPVILPLAGGLFAAAWIWAAFRPSYSQLTRIIALVIAAAIVVLPFVTKTTPPWFTGGRLTPAVPLLILLLSVAADDWLRLNLRGRLWSSIRQRQTLLVLATVAIVAGNLFALWNMTSNRDTLAQYNGGPYFACRAIADSLSDFTNVQYYGWSNCTIGQDGWMGVDAPVSTYGPSEPLPMATSLLPGTLIVNGHSHGLDAERIEQTIRLADDANSLHTVRTSRNLFGEISAVSFCYQCDDLGAPRSGAAVAQQENADAEANQNQRAPAAVPASAGLNTPVITPNPSDLPIAAVPTQHHPLQLASTVSVLVIPRPGAQLVVHNNQDLVGGNGCVEAPVAPEGDTRLLLIHPSVGDINHSPFFLVGCAPGQAALIIEADGEALTTYPITISPP